MKKYTIIILLSIMFAKEKIAAQNLVPNPSFEDTVSCPFSLSQIDRSSGWSSYKETPDYFNSCNNTQVGVPINFFGQQFPRTGNAYGGFYIYTSFATNYREIIGVELIQPLTIGLRYDVSFYVSLTTNTLNHIMIAANKIGVHFYTNSFSYTSPVAINNFAHVYSDSVIIDSLNWVRISGSFIADSSYQFLGVGNFFTDSLTTLFTLGANAAYAYYYIDDITVSVDSLYENILNNNLQNSAFSIYPNPTRDRITILGDGIKSISIIDAFNKVCITENINTASYLVDVSNLSRGVYFIKINTAKNIFFKKIILTN